MLRVEIRVGSRTPSRLPNTFVGPTPGRVGTVQSYSLRGRPSVRLYLLNTALCYSLNPCWTIYVLLRPDISWTSTRRNGILLSPTSFLFPSSVMHETRNGGNDFVITRSDGPRLRWSVGRPHQKSKGGKRLSLRAHRT